MPKSSKRKKALITGVSGQDGSYLVEFLLDKDYEVHGIIRRSSSFNTARIDHIYQDPHERGRRFFLHYGDLTDGTTIARLVKQIKPDEVYHLGAMSHVRVSFDIPEYTADVTGLGTLRILEAIREAGLPIKFYQASSSEMYGLPPAQPPYNEETPFRPASPYACAKVFAYYLTQNYRDAYGIFACNGILFNHESCRRGETFVTRKITRAVARIKKGLQKKLYLGNLETRRDWGWAQDYIEAMYLMLQQPHPDDYVIATGRAYSVKEFLEEAFNCVDLKWRKFVEIDPRYFRPLDPEVLIGDASKARKKLGWKPRVGFKELVRRMVEADMKLLQNPPREPDYENYH